MGGAMSPASTVPCRLLAAAEAFLPSAALVLAVATTTGAGCAKEPALPATVTPPSWPAGTVLALNATPIGEEEVDQVANVFARLQPQFVLAHCRRLALTNAIFPRIAAQSIDPERREKARAEAEALKARLVDGAPPPAPLGAPAEVERTGSAKSLGLEAWSAAIDAPIGRWSDVIETAGAFELVRLLERTEASSAMDVQLRVAVLELPYIDAERTHAAIDEALDRSTLTFVDPSWREYVPSAWLHRLHATSP